VVSLSTTGGGCIFPPGRVLFVVTSHPQEWDGVGRAALQGVLRTHSPRNCPQTLPNSHHPPPML
jgi:hypothetical protein